MQQTTSFTERQSPFDFTKPPACGTEIEIRPLHLYIGNLFAGFKLYLQQNTFGCSPLATFQT